MDTQTILSIAYSATGIITLIITSVIDIRKEMRETKEAKSKESTSKDQAQ